MKHINTAITALVASLLLLACQSPHTSQQRAADRAKIKDELQQEMSLKADREKLEELRKDIPEDTKDANDEMALYLEIMKQGRETPQNVREKFSTIVRKRRTSHRDKVSKLRDNYRKDETRRREDFLKKQKSEREKFTRKTKDSKDLRAFFRDQDKTRLNFFADERSRRQSFEAELSAQSKDFDSYMREKQKEFDEQYRLYSKKFYDKPKEKKAVTGDLDPFEKLNTQPATPLVTDP